MIEKIRKAIAHLATIGSLRRKGLEGLTSYGGSVKGAGEVEHKSGERAGTKTPFVLHGSVAKTKPRRPRIIQ